MILAVVFALAAAFSNAVNLMTRHKASISAPQKERGWRLPLYLIRQPLAPAKNCRTLRRIQPPALRHTQLAAYSPLGG